MNDFAKRQPTTENSLDGDKLLSIPAGSRIIVMSGGKEVTYYFEKLGVAHFMIVGS